RDAHAAAGVELVGLGPHEPAGGGRRAGVGARGRTVAVVVGAAHHLAPPVRQHAVFLQANAIADRTAAIDVHRALGVAPGADEAVTAVAVAHPREHRMRPDER